MSSYTSKKKETHTHTYAHVHTHTHTHPNPNSALMQTANGVYFMNHYEHSVIRFFCRPSYLTTLIKSVSQQPCACMCV